MEIPGIMSPIYYSLSLNPGSALDVSELFDQEDIDLMPFWLNKQTKTTLNAIKTKSFTVKS